MLPKNEHCNTNGLVVVLFYPHRKGVDKLLELPRSQMVHTLTSMTETYVVEHLEVLKELVERKMPEL